MYFFFQLFALNRETKNDRTVYIMNSLISIFIFLLVVFLYLHITAQYKTSEDLEIYEMDYTTNKELQEVCDIKQPLLFQYKDVNPEFFDLFSIEETNRNDIYVKDIQDYYANETGQIDSLLLPYQSVKTLMNTDSVGVYFSENNQDFIEEANLHSEFELNDAFLKPTMTAITKYDVCTGSKNCYTPLRYHNYYRQFYCVNSGKIRVKMTPFKSRKYMRTIKDYELYEFRSTVNVWNTKNGELEKVRFLEFDVTPGFVLYVPPYWYYSIKYVEDNTLLSGFNYQSVMNCVSNIPDMARYFIQQQNIKKKVTKTIPIIVDVSGGEIVEDEVSKKNTIEEKVAMLEVKPPVSTTSISDIN